MRVRWIGLVCAVAAVAALVGHQIGARTRPEPTTYGDATPVAAVSPSIPVRTVAPYSRDIDYPPLEPGLDYRTHLIGVPGYRWAYDAPRGWSMDTVGTLEQRWRPPDEPLVGGYSLRVKIVTAHLTNREMVEQKREAFETIYGDEQQVTAQSNDMISFRYRDLGTNTLRFNTFRWFTPVGGVTADFEMSVVGRAQDVDGLEDLFGQVGASVRKLP